MKPFATVAILTLTLSAGCTSETTDVADTDTSTTQTATPEMVATVGASDTSATTTGVTGGTVTFMSNDDKAFVVKAGQSGLAEIGLATTASQRASSAEVKRFAARMQTDHGIASQELRGLAIAKGLALPTSVDEAHKELGDRLATMSGSQFDREYMNAMVADHEQAVADFDKASREAQDADVKRWATSKLPILREHLAMARDIQTRIK